MAQPAHTLPGVLSQLAALAARQGSERADAISALADLSPERLLHGEAASQGGRTVSLHLAIPTSNRVERLVAGLEGGVVGMLSDEPCQVEEGEGEGEGEGERGRALEGVETLLADAVADADADGANERGLLLHDAKFPIELRGKLEEFISNAVTPPLYWGGDPSRQPDYWARCLVLGTIVGRAYHILAPRPEQTMLDLETDEEGRGLAERIRSLPPELRLHIYDAHISARLGAEWFFREAIAPVFLRAFFSGSDPEPGARFIAAVILLTACRALARTPYLVARGKDWRWMDGEIYDPHATWGMGDVFAALKESERTVPRGNTDWRLLAKQLRDDPSLRTPEYVPREILDMMDRAREEVERAERGEGVDWSGEVVQRVFEEEWREFWKEVGQAEGEDGEE